jgi:hypothetical protein
MILTQMNNIAMRFTLFSLLMMSFLLNFFGVQEARAAAPDPKVVVGYFSTEPAEKFEKEIKPLFEEFKGSCKNCEIQNLTPYDEKGAYSEKDLLDKVKAAPGEVSFFFFDWNKKITDQDRPLAKLLGEKIEAGKPVLAATGQALPDQPGSALSRTLMGQTPNAIIVGEVTGRERMLPQSFFGPEMLTAISAPKEHQGKGVGPLYFAARWAAVWTKRSATEWQSYFRTKKAKSRKIFLEVGDLLGR